MGGFGPFRFAATGQALGGGREVGVTADGVCTSGCALGLVMFKSVALHHWVSGPNE